MCCLQGLPWVLSVLMWCLALSCQWTLVGSRAILSAVSCPSTLSLESRGTDQPTFMSKARSTSWRHQLEPCDIADMHSPFGVSPAMGRLPTRHCVAHIEVWVVLRPSRTLSPF